MRRSNLRRNTRTLTVAERRKAQAYIQHSPRWYFQHAIDGNPWSAQIEIVEAVRDHPHVCVPSCHAAGKDWIAARIVPWFLEAFGPDCIVITTAPTDRQVKNVLWREIRNAYKNSKAVLPGDPPFKQHINIDEKHFAIGFTATDYDPNKFAGWHATNILIVLDEADGISKDVRDAIAGNLSGGQVARQFEIGNPLNPGSEFRKESEANYTHTIHLSAFDTPNFTAFGITREDYNSTDWLKKIDDRPMPAPYLISPSWVAKQVDKYGWEDPFVISRVLGQFPPAGPDTLVDHTWVETARELELKPGVPNILACDVARFGDDYTVIGHRQGGHYRTLTRKRKAPTTETANRLIWLWKKTGATSIRVDADGVGGGVVDILEQEGAPVVPMHGAAKPSTDSENRYYNARAEWHWQTRDVFRLGEIDIDPRDQDLIDQVKQVKIAGFPKGRILIEDKDEFKKRVGFSPDDWDCLVYAFADIPEIPLQVFI